jgi:hypothetical protein
MKKELNDTSVRKIAAIPIVLAAVSTIVAGIQASQGTWSSGELVFESWTACSNSTYTSEPCTYGVSPNAFAMAWPGFTLSALLLTFAFFMLFSGRLRSQIIGILKRPYAKIQTSMSENSKSRDLRKAAQKEMDEVAAAIKIPKPKYVLVASRNYSLVSFKSGTSTIVIFGIVAGIIAFIAQNNASASGILASVAFGSISQFLLALGFGGKLLIAAAKVVLEGLDGNYRETDKYEERSNQGD